MAVHQPLDALFGGFIITTNQIDVIRDLSESIYQIGAVFQHTLTSIRREHGVTGRCRWPCGDGLSILSPQGRECSKLTRRAFCAQGFHDAKAELAPVE